MQNNTLEFRKLCPSLRFHRVLNCSAPANSAQLRWVAQPPGLRLKVDLSCVALWSLRMRAPRVATGRVAYWSGQQFG